MLSTSHSRLVTWLWAIYFLFPFVSRMYYTNVIVHCILFDWGSKLMALSSLGVKLPKFDLISRLQSSIWFLFVKQFAAVRISYAIASSKNIYLFHSLLKLVKSCAFINPYDLSLCGLSRPSSKLTSLSFIP